MLLSQAPYKWRSCLNQPLATQVRGLTTVKRYPVHYGPVTSRSHHGLGA
jgi:hypothetical protein